MLKKYRQSTFIRGFTSLFTGSAIAQLIPLALSPYISRAFTVEEIAVYGLYMSLVSALSVSVSGKYDMAVMLPKSNADSVRLVHISVIVSLLVSTLIGILVFSFEDLWIVLLNNEDISQWFWSIPIATAFIGIYQAINYYLLRQRQFSSSALNKVAQRGVEGSGIIITGEGGFGGGLIVSDLLGRISMTGIALIQAVRNNNFTAKWSAVRLIALAKLYRQYPQNFALSSFANAAAMHLPLLFISNAYVVTITGYFNLMKYVLSAPISFISRNIAQIFLERLASKWKGQQPIVSDLLKLTSIMSIIALGFTLPILIFGEELFALVFGEEWSEAGRYAQIMVLSFGIKFVVSPLSSLLNAINKIKVASWWQWCYLVVILALIPMSRLELDISSFLLLYAMIECVMYVVYWILIYRQARTHDFILRTTI